uniref:ATP-grasp domain-containing protein n=1 Tax=Romanomermis culicivorax TaxID=13658 RepID=A0A915KG74_ROMCU
MKFVAQSCGITTPVYFFVYKTEDFANLKKSMCKNLKFPMLVKHHNGAGSEGLYKNCLVNCSKDLEDRITDTVKNYGGALVEEFVNVPITKNLRLWLYNAWQNRQEFEVTAIKRSSSHAEKHDVQKG